MDSFARDAVMLIKLDHAVINSACTPALWYSGKKKLSLARTVQLFQRTSLL